MLLRGLIKTLSVTLAASAAVSMVACSSHSKYASADDFYSDTQYAQADVNGVSGNPRLSGKSVSSEDRALLERRTFHFDFDRFVLHDEDREAIAAHARFLRDFPSAKIRIEGHTDERGSREYNIALGENRAFAVKKHLILHGIDSDQIAVVSFGQENPVALGHDEEAWAENRRAVIFYEES